MSHPHRSDKEIFTPTPKSRFLNIPMGFTHLKRPMSTVILLSKSFYTLVNSAGCQSYLEAMLLLLDVTLWYNDCPNRGLLKIEVKSHMCVGSYQ